jgi:hypothetical protein
VLDPTEIRAIERAGALRFHCVGDTGGLQNPAPQRRVTAAMLAELRAQDPVRFFYHLGDIVYLFGEEENYSPRFFAPYAEYRAPIFAIPGNHDGDSAPDASAASLLDRCFAHAGRAPDAVFAAHAHNYQRFSRVYDGRQIPYVVAGTGGFHNLHPVASRAPQPPSSFDGLPGVTLEAYQDADFGFMTVTASPHGADVTYSLVQPAGVQPFDAFPITPGELVGST